MSEQAYLDLLRDVMENGVDRGDRTGTGTRSVFGRQIRFDLSQGFPLLTTKKVFLRGIIEELLWFLRGSTNAKELEDKGVNIWKGWGNPDSRELGPVYGKQWRRWESSYEPSPFDIARHYCHGQDCSICKGLDMRRDWKPVNEVDQITDLVNRLRTDPNSRRHLVVAWNPGEIDQMALPPCHCLFQFYVRPLTLEQRDRWCVENTGSTHWGNLADGLTDAKREAGCDSVGAPKYALDCQLYQRSGDVFLGVPFNIASYALLTMMLAQQLGYAPGEFVHTFGDVHLYANHVEQAQEQLSREPYPFPQMVIRNAPDIFSYTIDSFDLQGYQSHPTIKAPVAV